MEKREPSFTAGSNVLSMENSIAAAAAKSLSHDRLCAAPWTAAHQAPPSLGFSR